MTHLTEEQLVDVYYDDRNHPHLQQCAECLAKFEDLEATLNAFRDLPVPEPPEFRWREPWRYRLLRLRGWALIPALAAALFAAFFIGRATRIPQPFPFSMQLADSGRERILLVALGNHLERSQMVLLELANGDVATFPAAQERARNLIGENRLYRQTALYTGDRNYAALLEELDRVLTAVANAQSNPSTTDADRIERLLFKIRVTDFNFEKGSEKL